MVLSVEEKPAALDRPAGTAPERGLAGTMTHDFKLHGTTTLFAAFKVLDGKVMGSSAPTSAWNSSNSYEAIAKRHRRWSCI